MLSLNNYSALHCVECTWVACVFIYNLFFLLFYALRIDEQRYNVCVCAYIKWYETSFSSLNRKINHRLEVYWWEQYYIGYFFSFIPLEIRNTIVEHEVSIYLYGIVCAVKSATKLIHNFSLKFVQSETNSANSVSFFVKQQLLRHSLPIASDL